MIVFMGVAGSGKSTQGKLLADRLALPWLSTGEFLRMMIAGQKRKEMLEGKLLSDAEIINMVQKIFALINTEEEFILDGFPRTNGQADWLLAQAKYGQLKVTAVVHLQASQEAVKQRLLNRGRQDDTQTAIDERFKEYEASLKPILEYFRGSRVPVLDINGEQDPNTIHEQLMTAIAPYINVHQS